MKQISIADMTLTDRAEKLSFKEKIEIARHLDNLQTDVIELPRIQNPATDSLLIHTVSAFVKFSTLSVETGLTEEGVKTAADAIANARKGRLRIAIPVSTVQMEYFCHMKPVKLLELAQALFADACGRCGDVELYAMDATRADLPFFRSLAELAVAAGVKTVTVCDDEGVMLPDEVAKFISDLRGEIPALEKVRLGILCRNTNGMATANALMTVKSGVDEVKTCVGSDMVPQTRMLAGILHRNADRVGACIGLNCHALQRITGQIEWILGISGAANPGAVCEEGGEEAPLDGNDTLETVTAAVQHLGYDLSAEDYGKVYEEFLRMAGRKTVGQKELEAIVANVALQVPPTYVLESYVINSGNVISASAQIKMLKKGEPAIGLCMGDGPVDASFKALEQIIGVHFELDDFQIQSVTRGREALGVALVKLRHNGKLYSGSGISTDIIGSSIRAYINAVNKIVYEEV